MFTTNDLRIPVVVNALVKTICQNHPDINVKQKAALLGRSDAWLYKKSKELGVTVKSRRSADEFYDFLDSIPYGSARVVKGYALSTVVTYTSKYCLAQKENVRYRVTETKTGCAVKLFVSNKPRRKSPKRAKKAR
jgi:hypothetical protein